MQIMPASMHFALDCMQGWTGRLEGATFCGTRGDAVAAGVDRATSNREELSNVYENECALFHHGRGGGLGRGWHGRCGRRDAEGVAPMPGLQGRSPRREGADHRAQGWGWRGCTGDPGPSTRPV